MILNRLGNKQLIANKIIRHFPPHNMFIDMFFGAGGLFFKKPQVQYNICNDIDSNIFNLYTTLKERKDELINAIEIMPIDENLMKYWCTNKESEPIEKSIRFLMLSNFCLYGKDGTLAFGECRGHEKKSILNKIHDTFLLIKNVKFMCCDFRDVLTKITFRDDKDHAFIYADPPYIGQTNNYEHEFEKKGTDDLFKVLINSGIRFAISEFDNDFILWQAKYYGLNVIEIGERQNLKNRRNEILITNYDSQFVSNSLFNLVI